MIKCEDRKWTAGHHINIQVTEIAQLTLKAEMQNKWLNTATRKTTVERMQFTWKQQQGTWGGVWGGEVGRWEKQITQTHFRDSSSKRIKKEKKETCMTIPTEIVSKVSTEAITASLPTPSLHLLDTKRRNYAYQRAVRDYWFQKDFMLIL